LIGSKPPGSKDVWSIRTKLQVEKHTRDLAMFNLAIDSKLRSCNVVTLKVKAGVPHGMAVDRARVRERKTGHHVDRNCASSDDRLAIAGKVEL
jgi:hypothetical protein